MNSLMRTLAYHETCYLCECPVVDGGVQACQVDRVKFAEWSLDTFGRDSSSDLQPRHVFCYFCVWDAQIMNDSLVGVEKKGTKIVWWPNDDELQHDAKLMKGYYLDQKINPCSVHLERINIPENEEPESEEEKDSMETCPYCKKKFLSVSKHIIRRHRREGNAIQWEHNRRGALFKTLADRDKGSSRRMDEDSTTLMELNNDLCQPDPQIRCNYRRRISAFSDCEPAQKRGKCMHLCDLCQFSTKNKKNFEKHMEEHRLSSPNDKVKGSPESLPCRNCRLSVPIGISKKHYTAVSCAACRTRFPCCGLLAFHREKCKRADKHVRGLKFKQQDAKCEPCMRYFRDKDSLEKHQVLVHNKRVKQCAHCDDTFSNVKALVLHLANVHELLRKKFKCHACKCRFFLKTELAKHQKAEHRKSARKLKS